MRQTLHAIPGQPIHRRAREKTMKTEKLSDTVTIINADCREWSGVADAVISDPPYGIDWDGNCTRFTSGFGVARNNHSTINHGGIANDKEPFDPSPWLSFRRVVLWGYPFFAGRVPVGTTLVWDKRFANGKAFLADAEIGWCKSQYAKPGPHMGGYGAYIYSQTWQGFVRSEPVEHPTQKPEKLMRWCMDKANVAHGAIVLDPYMGSGTTGIACIRTGRRFIGIEIDEQHYQTARRRLLDELARTNLFGQDEDARAGQGECPGTACNSGRDAMPLDIFEGIQ